MRIQEYNFITKIRSLIISHKTSSTFLMVYGQKVPLKIFIGNNIFNLYFKKDHLDKQTRLPLIYPYKKGNTWILVANNEWDKLREDYKRSTIMFMFDIVDSLVKNNLDKIDVITYENVLLTRVKHDKYLLEYFIALKSLLDNNLYIDSKPCSAEESDALFDIRKFKYILKTIKEILFEKNTSTSFKNVYNILVIKYNLFIPNREIHKENDILSLEARTYRLVKWYLYNNL